MATLPSFGRFPPLRQQDARGVFFHHEAALGTDQGSALPRGNGRSYGDGCLNEGGTLLLGRSCNRLLAFDTKTGVLRCEAGTTLEEIIDFALPQGFFLPVTPGTRLVTVGGAIANDVHGKNHHAAGTFGCHVPRFKLWRSDRRPMLCTPQQKDDWFGATVGGLGLTGWIGWADIQLVRVANPFLVAEELPFANLEEFFTLSAASDRDFDYTVAWVDCLAPRRARGRGILWRANHAPPLAKGSAGLGWRASIPFELPFPAVGPRRIRAFNALYYHWKRLQPATRLAHYKGFFYPLDHIAHWNRLYGPKGFLQLQCVLPHEHASFVIHELLERCAAAGLGSFLAVLKVFGARPSPGWLSFPRPGVTLALDIPHQGERTLAALRTLYAMIFAAGGAIYPAKDALMTKEQFQAAYPRWMELAARRDPAISSSLWRRVSP